jgi:predicted Zn-dependent peptidase
LSVTVDRETTTYTLSFLPEQQEEAVDFLGDILTNSVYNKSQIEVERDAIYRNTLENHKDQYQATIEAAHYTSFRDHFISQPVSGVRENIANVTEEQIRAYLAQNHCGNNFVVIGTGSVNHEQLAAQVGKAFGSLPQNVNPFLVLKSFYLFLSRLFQRRLAQLFFPQYCLILRSLRWDKFLEKSSDYSEKIQHLLLITQLSWIFY